VTEEEKRDRYRGKSHVKTEMRLDQGMPRIANRILSYQKLGERWEMDSSPKPPGRTNPTNTLTF
jgi:hypothetical protein